tara:strand:+ start:3183 stop:3365 length:183 start_codon:yes stop_codon:yes gene_type:complete
MVAFARSQAKSILSKLKLIDISKNQIQATVKGTNQEKSIEKEKNSNNFLEAIKKGGVWLS